MAGIKKILEKTLSIILAASVVLGVLPLVAPTAAVADETTDAFGIDISKTIGNTDKSDNPYGTDDWFSLFAKSELVETRTKRQDDNSKRTQITYRYTTNSGSSRTNEAEFSLSNGYSLISTVAFDPYGNGRDEYVANLAYSDKEDKLWLYITNSYGVVGSYTAVETGNTMLGHADSYHATSHMAITAGDYDGDGEDSIIVYAPLTLSLKEYTWDGGAPIYEGAVISIGSALGTSGDARVNLMMENQQAQNRNRLRATPSVQLTTGDTDKDTKDELIITANYNDIPKDKYGDTSTVWQCSWLNVYDYDSSWSKTFSTVLEESKDETAKGRLRFAGSAVGNIEISDNDTVDYPEIVTAGWIDQSSGTGCNIDEGKYGVYIYRWSATAKTYERIQKDVRISASEFSSGGAYDSNTIQDPVCVVTFAAEGLSAAEYIFIEGDVYKYTPDDDTSNVLTFKNRDSYFKDDDDGIGRFAIAQGGVQTAVAANFDGNTDGREQVVFTTCQKYMHGSRHFFRTWYYYYTGNSEDGYTFNSGNNGWSLYGHGESAVSLAAADIGKKDGIVARILEKSLKYTEPEVIAILEAPPYFEEIDNDNNSATEYGQMTEEGNSKTSSTTVTAGVIVGFERTDPISGSGGGFEANITNEWNWETTESVSKEYNITWSNDTGENTVIVYRAPVTVYKYEYIDYTSDSTVKDTMIIGVQGTPATNMITVDEYNSAAAAYGMDTITVGTNQMLGEPGNPQSYRGALPQSETTSHSWVADGGTTSWGSSSGTVYKTLENTKTTEHTSTYNFSTEFSAYGIVCGAKVGGSAGAGFGMGTVTLDSSGTIKTGAVSARPGDVDNIEAYNFNWNFATWTQELNGEQVPVLGYIVTGVKAPPSPPQNLALSDHSATTMKLTWEQGTRSADEFVVYRYNPNSPYQIYSKIGTVSGGDVEDGTYSMTLTGLSPNTTYQYVITAVSTDHGESVYSEVVTGTTLPESGSSLTIDSESPKDTSALQGDNASFSVDVTPGTYNSVAYQWQEKLSGENWTDISGANSSKLTVQATAARAGARYRCIVYGMSTAGDAVPYYSSAAILTVGREDVTPALSIKESGVSSTLNGSGTAAGPYTGTADYTEITTTPTEEKVEVPATVSVAIGSESRTAYVYRVGGEDGPYVAIADVEETDNNGDVVVKQYYYSVTKSGDTYTAGTELTYLEKTSYGAETASLEEPLLVELTVGEKTKTYYRYAAFEGTVSDDSGDNVLTAVTSMDTNTYISADGSTFYGYTSGMTALPEESDLEDDTLTALIYAEDTESNTMIIGLEGDSDETLYEVTKTTTEKTTSYGVTPLTRAVTTTLTGDGFEAQTNPVFEIVNVTETKNVITEEAENVPGTQLALTISTTKAGTGETQVTATNVAVVVEIVNQTSGVSENIATKTGSGGSVNVLWTAPSAGLYAISVAAGSNRSDTLYYLASGTESSSYLIELTDTSDSSKGSLTEATYGDTLNIALKQATVDATSEGVTQTDVTTEGIAYSYTKDGASKEYKIEAPKSFRPSSAGVYVITAKDDSGAELASTLLTVGKKAITVSPGWEGKAEGAAVAKLSDITAVVQNDALASGDSVNNVFDIVCELYDTDGDIITSKSGAFDVSLQYRTDRDGGYTTAVTEFLSKYSVTLQTGKILRKLNTYAVTYSMGENGASIEGRYGDSLTAFNSGALIEVGRKVRITATPNSGFAVDEWTVTQGGKTLTEDTDYKITSSNTILTIAGMGTGALDIQVTFRSDHHTVSYYVDGSNGTLTATNADGNTVSNGGSVQDGATVTFTAAPDDEYSVAKWTVDGETYYWEGSTELYRENTLTLSDIQDDVAVTVAYAKAEPHTLTTEVGHEDDDVNVTGVAITAVDAATGDTADLTEVRDGAALTFSVTTSDTLGVKEWQIDKGDGYTTVSKSGGCSSITVYNITGDWKVKAVITTAQTHTLTYSVTMGDTTVTDANIAELTASSNGVALSASPVTLGAYVSVDFNLTLAKGYKVVSWSGATQSDANDTAATLDSLTANTTVTVEIAALGKTEVSYSVVDVNGAVDGGTNGTLAAAHSRLGMTEYIETNSAGTSGTITLWEGGELTLTARPDDGYQVKEWTVGGTVYKSGDESWTGETLTLSGVTESTLDVTVQFELGDPKITFAQPANGTLTAESAGAAFTSGGTTATKEVVFTVVPDENYGVKEWQVNGTAVDGETGTTYTLTATGNTEVAVVLQGELLTVTASAGTGGTVTAPETVRYGEDVTISATPNTGYVFSGWYSGGTKVSDAADYSFTAYENGAYTARFTASDGGTVSFSVNDTTMGSISARVAGGSTISSGATVGGGRTVTFTVTPASGYRIQNWSDNVTVDSNNGNIATVTVGSSDLNVVATLEKIPDHTITIITPANGSITAQVNGEDVKTVTDGTEVTFTATANPYWMFDSWMDDAKDEKAAVFTMAVTKDITVGAEFKEAVNYTVNYRVDGANGTVSGTYGTEGTSITANTSVQIVGGSSLEFTAAPSSGYMVKEWTVNGKTVEGNLSRTLTIDRLGENTEITVSFETEQLYSVPASVSSDYTVSGIEKTPNDCGGDNQIRKGGDVTFTVTPVSGKTITSITALPEGATQKRNDDGSITVTVENVTNNITPTITTTNGITLVITTPENGSITVKRGSAALSGSAALQAGDELTITATPESGYTLSTLTVNNEIINGRTYTVPIDGSVAAVTITATFTQASSGGGGGGGAAEPETYSIKVPASVEHGSVSVSPESASEGDTVTVTLTPDEGYEPETLVVRDADGNVLKLTKISDTVYTFTMPGSEAAIEAAFAEKSETGPLPFTDVEETDWFYDDVKFVYEMGLMLGTDEESFSPHTEITRGMLVTILYRLAEEPDVTGDCPFGDVTEGSYYEAAIAWAQEHGIVTGYTDDSFGPDDPITREQFATILQRYARYSDSGVSGDDDKELTGFTDTEDISNYAVSAIEWACNAGIIRGTSDTTLSPQGTATRAQTAAMLRRYIEQLAD